MGYIYPPQKSVLVNFLWGRNDVRTAIEVKLNMRIEGLYLPKKILYPPLPPKKEQVSGYAPACIDLAWTLSK